MTLLDRVKQLCKEKDISQGRMEKAIGISNGASSKWKTSSPSLEILKKLSDYFEVSVEYLMTGETDSNYGRPLSAKDEKDIAKRLEDALCDLSSTQDGLMFSGQPLDDETRELLKASLENSIRIGKINAKKFTPDKYKDQ